jgi:hypothetical protein
VECLFCKHKALSSNSIPPKKKKKKSLLRNTANLAKAATFAALDGESHWGTVQSFQEAEPGGIRPAEREVAGDAAQLFLLQSPLRIMLWKSSLS